ncbi:MAG: class I SAM-dependent methyltransferase [Magnetovibrio sp.]|nr:class I SAM-dependent methyltransferase [Magnetovibrio sp.]
MPTSLALGKPLTGLVLARLAADGLAGRIVDVGPGLGVYARLFRDLTGTATWVGVEAWAPYVEAYGLREWYDDIVVADVRYLDFAKLGTADVILFGDVLEHMSAAEAADVLARAGAQARLMVMSIPLGPWPQDEIDGNPFEAHVEDNLSNAEVQDLIPGICGGQAYVNDQGYGIGLYFATMDDGARAHLQAHVAAAEDLLAAHAPADLMNRVNVDFADDADIGAYRAAIAQLTAQGSA